jgi:hypothetical protein
MLVYQLFDSLLTVELNLQDDLRMYDRDLKHFFEMNIFIIETVVGNPDDKLDISYHQYWVRLDVVQFSDHNVLFHKLGELVSLNLNP